MRIGLRLVAAFITFLAGLNILPVLLLSRYPEPATALAASRYPNPTRPETLWRLVWSDEFNGPPCDPADPARCSAKDWQNLQRVAGDLTVKNVCETGP